MVSDKVSTEEVTGLRDYELVLVISPELDEDKFGVVVDNVNRFVTGRGGVVSETVKWGKRKLAYPLRHFVEGSYVLMKLKLRPAVGKELEASLRISEDVLRHLLIRSGD